jgi:hypothetical protein
MRRIYLFYAGNAGLAGAVWLLPAAAWMAASDIRFLTGLSPGSE